MAKRLTEAEKGKIKELREKGYSCEEISDSVNRSVSTIANYLIVIDSNEARTPASIETPPTLPNVLDQPDVFDKYKLQLAAKSLNVATTLVHSIEQMSAIELRKTPLSQRAIAAGILMDKFKLLTQPDPQDIVDQVASIVSLIAKATPPRAKDAAPIDVTPTLPDPDTDPDPEDVYHG